MSGVLVTRRKSRARSLNASGSNVAHCTACTMEQRRSCATDGLHSWTPDRADCHLQVGRGSRSRDTPTCFKEMMRKLRHSSEELTFAEVFKETATKNGYGNLSIKCCPQCGTFVLRTQCCFLHCGMIATYQGGGTEITFSADTIFGQQPAVAATAAGSAQRSGAEAPVTPPRTVVEAEMRMTSASLNNK